METNKTKWLIYVLAAYTFIQFSWWFYLLTKLYTQNYYLKNGSFVHADELTRKIWMIAGEGLVFFILLSFGAYTIIKNYKNQVKATQRENDLLLSFTHELRTPLASTQLHMQTMQKHTLNNEQTKQVVNSVLADTDRLNNLVNRILMAARLNSSTQLELDIKPHNIVELTEKTLQNHPHKSRIKWSVNTDFEIKVDALAFSSMVLNVFENACKYSPIESKIEIETFANDKVKQLLFKDFGVGIEDNKKKLVFNRFYRIKNNTKQTGTGLGLYVVKELAKAQNFNVLLKNNTPKGSIFILEF